MTRPPDGATLKTPRMVSEGRAAHETYRGHMYGPSARSVPEHTHLFVPFEGEATRRCSSPPSTSWVPYVRFPIALRRSREAPSCRHRLAPSTPLRSPSQGKRVQDTHRRRTRKPSPAEFAPRTFTPLIATDRWIREESTHCHCHHRIVRCHYCTPRHAYTRRRSTRNTASHQGRPLRPSPPRQETATRRAHPPLPAAALDRRRKR